ncbi:lipid-A-disaccharide synthase [Limnohabitans sp. 2KL-1]|uniref:lipid-A-disaccharide synthase n=1 Tax=Limnohabitans sp. 2KL-1 TaxID=1100699 RepID=UPI000D3CDD40|nr:lipid-A-disaccharide synthase [Limnohabitans sp. 2KL-1]PUE47153.1 lipid-A-disaccharide synthase [Limnohabitans sp. 2KL-1]
MVAGEASGDLLAGLLIQGLQSRWPQARGHGIGGPRMTALGFDAWWPHERLAVRGYVEVLRHYRGIVAIREQLKQRLLAKPPDVFIGVDAPDFNLDLETHLKAAGIPTVHFVCPSIWAWRPERIEKIRRSVDHMLCIFPFEPELLARAGIDATYVGHPLAQTIPMTPDRQAARALLGLDSERPVVALLPGSRRSEIEHLTPRFIRAAQLMRRQNPSLQFVLPAIPGLLPQVQNLVDTAGALSGLHLLKGQSHQALAACDVTLIASGTATLEAALFKRPMVIGYHMNWISWQIMRRQKLQPWVGLPNILCEDFVVPEFLQDQCTPEALAKATLAWLSQPDRADALQSRFQALHLMLQRDTAKLSTHALEKVLEA